MTRIDDGTMADIAAGRATDEQLQQLVSPDAMNRLAAQWRSPETTMNEFLRWYAAVMEPIGADRDDSYSMFIGETSVEDFAGSLPDDVLDAFLERFEDLQRAYVDSRTASNREWLA